MVSQLDLKRLWKNTLELTLVVRAAYQVGVINRDAGLFEEAIAAFDQVDFE